MIEGGWAYVWAAYALTSGGMLALVVVVASRARYWAKRARALDEGKDKT